MELTGKQKKDLSLALRFLLKHFPNTVRDDFPSIKEIQEELTKEKEGDYGFAE